jgi:transposase
MAQVEIIRGAERRRRWSEEEKRAIVAEAFAPGAKVTVVARRADLHSGQLYRWKRELGEEAVGFSRVVVAPGASAVTERREEVIEVMVGNDRRARIPALMSPALAAAVIRALVRR